MSLEPNKVTTSSHDLGRRLGISSAQIRKDLSHFGEFGKQGTGYHIEYLISELLGILHLDRDWPVVLVGVGYLGHALAHYQEFQNRGFHIRWLFDNDPSLVGQVVNGLTVQDVREAPAVIRREGVEIAVLAVPATAAQALSDTLIAAGIRSILSYAPISLVVPPDIQVRYSDPVIQLQQMTFYLKE
jgi:redox-sensing transcriptional repressor